MEGELIRMIAGMVFLALILGIILSANTFCTSSKIVEKSRCRMYWCTDQKIGGATGGLGSIPADSETFCYSDTINLPYIDEKNQNSIALNMARLIANAWEMTCDGPNDEAWTRWKSVAGRKECFRAYTFRIDGEVLAKQHPDGLGALDVLLATAQQKYKVPKADDERGSQWSVMDYVQEYDTPGTIMVLPKINGLESERKFQVDGTLYSVIVANDQNLFRAIGIGGLKKPHVIIVETTQEKALCG